MEKIKTIWIIIDHPTQLATALGFNSFINRQKYQINLLISKHPYWKRVPIEMYRDSFDSIIIFERPGYSKNPFKILKNLMLIFKIKRKIKTLNFRRDDIIIGLSIFNYIENIVLSVHKNCIKIAMMPLGVYNECNDPLPRNLYCETIEGFIFSRLVEPLFSLNRTFYKHIRNHKEIPPRIRYQKPLTKIYDYIIVLASKKNTISMNENIYFMPFPYINDTCFLSIKNKKKIIFFGVPFRNGLWGLSAQMFAQNMNHCLDFLRKCYFPKFSLIYRPHPLEVNEMNMLDLEHFKVESDGLLSELYFMQNYSEIQAIFSIASTSSRSGFFFSLPSYVFCKVFPFNEIMQRLISENEMGDLPDSFYIKDLSSFQINHFNIFPGNHDLCDTTIKDIFDKIERLNDERNKPKFI